MTSNTPRGAPPLPTTAATYRQFAYNGRGELTAGIVPRHGSQRRDQRHRGSDFLSQQESSCIRPGPSVDDIVHRTDFRRTALLVQDIETPRQCPVSAHQCKCAQDKAEICCICRSPAWRNDSDRASWGRIVFLDLSRGSVAVRLRGNPRIPGLFSRRPEDWIGES